TILRRMPFHHQMWMGDRNGILPAVTRIGGAMKAADTEGTVAPLAIIHRGIPDMIGVRGTLPPDPLARVIGDVIGREGAVLGGMPGGGELGGFPAQRARVKGFVVACAHGEGTPAAARALAIPGFDGGAPDMVRIPMTLPPHRVRAVGGAAVECEVAVFRRMPIAGEVGASKAEGRRRACLRGPSGPSLWRRSFVHRGGAMRGPHLDNTVRR